jgi:hypothetical protein
MIRSTAGARFALALLLAAGLGGCGEDPTGGGTPVPGDMLATIESPTGVASALLEVVSGTVSSVSSNDQDLLVERVATQPVRIVVIRGTPGPVSFRVRTEDVTHPPEIRVVEVGSADDELLPNVSGYAVSLVEEAGS